MKKKLIIALLVPVVALTLAGCGKNQSTSSSSQEAPQQSEEEARLSWESSRSASMEAVRSADEEAAKKASALAALNAAAKPASSATSEEPSTSAEEPATSVEEPAAEEPPKTSSATPAAPASQDYPTNVDGIGVRFRKSVNGDVTGKWRVAIISDSSDLNAYVVDFYKAYIKDSSELLGIVNHDLKTTTCVKNFLGDWLDITIHVYQPGEESDAKKLFGGKVLDNYWINMATGEIDLLEDD